MMNNFISSCIQKLIGKPTRIHSIQKFKFQRNISLITTQENVQDHETQIKIGKATINHIIAGKGIRPIVCIPGALGSIWTDFKPQINGLDRSKFKIVVFDPPGYGKSRPPNRQFNLDFYHTDATVAFDLMNELGFPKFSVLGWSDGGIAGLILAAKYPEAIDKLVVWGANSYLLPEDIEHFEKIRDTKKWSPQAKSSLIELYGEDDLQRMWSNWCDVMNTMLIAKKGNICMESVSKIKCPTLILHGAKDPLILGEHPNYLLANIRHSSLHIFPKGKHNIHLRYAQEFNNIVTQFLINT